MKTLLVSEFKTKCVGVLNEVADYGEEVVVTKRGKPLARIVPAGEPRSGHRAAGDRARDSRITGDVVDPGSGNDWESLV